MHTLMHTGGPGEGGTGEASEESAPEPAATAVAVWYRYLRATLPAAGSPRQSSALVSTCNPMGHGPNARPLNSPWIEAWNQLGEVRPGPALRHLSLQVPVQALDPFDCSICIPLAQALTLTVAVGGRGPQQGL